MVVAGQLMLAAAIVICLTLPLAAVARAALCLACLVLGCLELRRLRRGHANCCEIRLFAGGDALILDRAGEWQPAKLESGSILLHNYAWLRLRGDGGTVYNELLCGDARVDPEWRRLHVIWRHIGAS